MTARSRSSAPRWTTLAVATLWAVAVSCHLDKLLNGVKTPPSEAPPARVAFSSPPSGARAGEPINPPVQVTVQDSAGHVTLRDTLVILSLGANPSGDSLRGDTVAHSVNGVATFVNVRLDKAARGYRLAAAAPELHPDTSPAFSVMPAPATVLAFTVQPRDTMQDSVIKPPVQVTAYDALGNTATDFTGPIRMAFGTDASVSRKAALAGTNPVPAVAGVATFTDLAVNEPGVGYTLTAAFGSAAPVATSAAFKITPGPPPNQPPVAAFTSSCTLLVCTFTSTSSDPDGTIASYRWTFGDGTAAATTQNPSHTYTAGGTFTVTLTVTDNQSATGSVSHPVTVTAPPPPNQPPVAAFTSSCTQLTCSFTSTSSDPDGTIASYRWTFGDGTAAATTQNPSHTYTAGGTFTVTLTVTDNQSATGSVSHPVTVTAPPPPNQPPVAAFTSSCTLLVCSFTSTSSDPDGTIASYRWTFGDGTAAATTQNPSHTYTAGGTFTVTLTVTDNQSATGSVSHPVTVTAPPPPNQPPVAAFTSSCTQLTCSFTSTSSDPDGTIASYRWTFGDGTAAATVANPSHTYTAGGTFTVALTVTDNQNATGSVSHPVTVTAPPPPNQPPVAAFTSSCTQLTCSFTSTSSDPDGTIASYRWTFGDGTAAATVANPSHTYTAGGTFTVALTVTDNQNATGSVSHPVTVTAPPPPNQPPVAAFTSSCTQLTCSFTSTSSDPDGTIASYRWTFGDGTAAATTQNPSHTYTAGGTFTVTLTVTDNRNATGSVSHPVTVTAPPPPNQPPVVNAGSDDHALTGLLYSFSWSFSDGNHNGPWSYRIDWGDGQTSTGNVSTEGTLSSGHTYIIILPRSFTITVTVTDASGASGSDSKVVSVTLL